MIDCVPVTVSWREKIRIALLSFSLAHWHVSGSWYADYFKLELKTGTYTTTTGPQYWEVADFPCRLHYNSTYQELYMYKKLDIQEA